MLSPPRNELSNKSTDMNNKNARQSILWLYWQTFPPWNYCAFFQNWYAIVSDARHDKYDAAICLIDNVLLFWAHFVQLCTVSRLHMLHMLGSFLERDDPLSAQVGRRTLRYFKQNYLYRVAAWVLTKAVDSRCVRIRTRGSARVRSSCVSVRVCLSVFVRLSDVWFNPHLLRILDFFLTGSAPVWRSGNSVVRPCVLH